MTTPHPSPSKILITVLPKVEDVIGRPLSPYAITIPNVSNKVVRIILSYRLCEPGGLEQVKRQTIKLKISDRTNFEH